MRTSANTLLGSFLERHLNGHEDLLSMLPIAVVLVELRPQIRLAYVSAQFETMTGHAAADALRDPEQARRWVCPDDLEALDSGFRRLQREGDRFSSEFRLQRADGEVRWFACEAIARSADPDSLAVVFTLADVTERKHIEHDLEVERRERESLIEALPAVVYEMILEPGRWRLSYVSPKLLELTGYSETELLADRELAARLVHPEDAPTLAEAMQRTWVERESGECSYRVVRKDGSTAWVRNRWSVVASPTPESMRIRGIVTDVTEQRAAQSRAEETLRLHRTLIEHISGFVFVIRISERGLQMVYLSPQSAEFFGRDLSTLLGGSFTTWAGLLHPEDLPRVLAEARNIFQSGQAVQLDVRFRMPDGSLKWTRMDASVLSAPGRSEIDVLGVGRDVTAEREREERARREHELESQLMRADRLTAVGQLAAGIAHEVNNALASLLPYGSLLSIDSALPDYARDHGRKIEEQAHRIAAIVRGLLNLARQQLPKKAVWPLDELVRDTLTLVGAEARRADVTVDTQVPSGLAVFGDRGQLQQVVLNLVSNAIQAVLERPLRKLEISARSVPGAVEIRVADSGPGIAPEIRDRLFTGFVTTRPNGSGLGLSISASIVKAHGGTLAVDDGIGEGACFVIRLPIAVAGEESAETEALPIAPADRTLRALIVDDEPGVRMGFAKLLGRFGVEVESASDGPSALRRLEEHPVDVVFLDLRMPGMSGMDVYERLHRTHPAIAERVVLMTADAASLEVRVFLDSVDRPVLLKPFDLGTVREVIRRASGVESPDAGRTAH